MKLKKMLMLLVCLALCLVLTGCGEKGTPAGDNGAAAALNLNDMTCAQIAQLAQDAVEFSPLTDMDAKYMDKYLWISVDDLDDWVLRRDATRATPEMILVIKVKEGVDMAPIKEAIQDYHNSQITEYSGYQPAQMPKLESAKVMENGRYIVLVVSPDAAKVNAVLGTGWK